MVHVKHATRENLFKLLVAFKHGKWNARDFARQETLAAVALRPSRIEGHSTVARRSFARQIGAIKHNTTCFAWDRRCLNGVVHVSAGIVESERVQYVRGR